MSVLCFSNGVENVIRAKMRHSSQDIASLSHARQPASRESQGSGNSAIMVNSILIIYPLVSIQKWEA